MPDDAPRKPRLLLFEQRQVGDAVVSLPFVRSAGTKYDLFVTCAVHSAEIFRMVLPPDRVIPWTPPWIASGRGLAKWRSAGIPAFIRTLKALRADSAASVWADARVHLLMALTGIKTRAGFPMTPNNFYASHLPRRQRQIKIGKLITIAGSIATGGPLLTRKIDRSEFYQHHILDYRDLAAVLGIPWDETRPWLPAGAARPAGPPVWLIHPGARFPGRQWPIAFFARIIREVLNPAGVRTLFIRPPEIDPSALPSLPPETEVIAPANLADFLNVIRGVDVLLCNDTGVSHMGAALGKRIVSILTNSEPRWFAPRGSEGDTIYTNVCPYRPCLDNCVMPSYICLEAITYEMVRDKVLSILSAPAPV